MSTAERLTKGCYYMMVTDVIRKDKTFTREGRLHYVHYVHFVTANSEKKIGEFITTTPEQYAFTPQTFAHFQVTFNGTYGDEIEPITEAQYNNCNPVSNFEDHTSDKQEIERTRIAFAAAANIVAAKVSVAMVSEDDEIRSQIKTLALLLKDDLAQLESGTPF